MKDIFSELYNKVLGFFRQTEKEEESAKDVACNRLKFVLMQDRTNLTPELMDRMRRELVDLLSKYVEMDKEALELGFEQEGSQMALMLSIPVVRAKDEAEIEAVLAKEDDEKAKKLEEESNEVSEDDQSEESTVDETEISESDDNVEIAENNIESSDDDIVKEVDAREEAGEDKSEPVAVGVGASSKKRK